MKSEEWDIRNVKDGSTTDGIIAQRAWQIFIDDVESKDMGFSQSEKDEIRNYICTHTGLVSISKFRELADDCIRRAIARIERDKLRRR